MVGSGGSGLKLCDRTHWHRRWSALLRGAVAPTAVILYSNKTVLWLDIRMDDMLLAQETQSGHQLQCDVPQIPHAFLVNRILSMFIDIVAVVVIGSIDAAASMQRR